MGYVLGYVYVGAWIGELKFGGGTDGFVLVWSGVDVLGGVFVYSMGLSLLLVRYPGFPLVCVSESGSPLRLGLRVRLLSQCASIFLCSVW